MQRHSPLRTLGFILIFAATAHANPASNQNDQACSPNRVGSGELLCKLQDSFAPLPMLNMDVKLSVTGFIVHGTVTQEFNNPHAEVIEAIYVFPLPENAAVHEMEMRIGERRIISVVQEKEEARETYERAKQRGAKAALTEQERPNLFTSSVANINPGETVRVRLEYQHESTYERGLFTLVFPLTFTPRYVPDVIGAALHPSGSIHPVSRTVDDADRITPPFVKRANPAVPRASIEASIYAGLPLARVACRSHIVESEVCEDRWTVRPRTGSVIADRDFILEWAPKADTTPETALLTEEREGASYALMMLLPPTGGPESPATTGGPESHLPTETLFIIDVSGSMNGPSINQAREALIAALARLRPGDTFNLLEFNNSSSTYLSCFQEASPPAIRNAQEWARSLTASGGTEIHSALVRGISLVQQSTTERIQRIILLTDASVGNEQQVLEWIETNLGGIRLHVLGIGYAPNRYLMRKMAEFGHGLCQFISETGGIENKIDRFLERINRPAMTDLSLNWKGVEVEEVYPSRLPDLHIDEPVYLSARIRRTSADGRLIVSGRTAQREITVDLPIRPNAPHESGVATRWARAKVADLTDQSMRGNNDAALRAEIIRVGIDFKLVTKYTSLVAVEQIPTAAGPGETKWVASGLPHGSRLLGGSLPRGGTSGPLQLLLGFVLSGTSLLLARFVLRKRGT